MPGAPKQRGLRRLSDVDFALCCGTLHFTLAAVALVVALSAADSGGQVVFVNFVGYLAAFSIWVVVRGQLFVRYVRVRPPRGAAGAGILLLAHMIMLAVSFPIALVLGWLVLPAAVFLSMFAVPAAVTWWTVQPLSPPRWSSSSSRAGRGLVWSLAVVVLFLVGTRLFLASLVSVLPGDP